MLHTALFNFKDDLLEINDLTEDHVHAAVSLVSELLKCERRHDKKLFSSKGLVLTASYLAPIINHDWPMGDVRTILSLFLIPNVFYNNYLLINFTFLLILQVINAYIRHLSRRVPNDRVLGSTWRALWLIQGKSRGKEYHPPGHPQVEIEKKQAIRRCQFEYFHKPKVSATTCNILHNSLNVYFNILMPSMLYYCSFILLLMFMIIIGSLL
jgi:hypothetical protein